MTSFATSFVAFVVCFVLFVPLFAVARPAQQADPDSVRIDALETRVTLLESIVFTATPLPVQTTTAPTPTAPTATPTATPRPVAESPLRVLVSNPRWLTADGTTALYLAGSHIWTNVQSTINLPDVSANPGAYFAAFAGRGHNHTRLWAWEAWQHDDAFCLQNFCPLGVLPYTETSPHIYDLSAINPQFVAQLRASIAAAKANGVYVTVMLFQGWSATNFGDARADPFQWNPYHAGNNINGVTMTDGNRLFTCDMMTRTYAGRSVWSYQTAYASAVVSATLEFDNVIYEVGNEIESLNDGLCWQRAMAAHIRTQSNGRRLVGISGTHPWALADWPAQLASDVDWVSPTNYTGDNTDPGGFRTNPPAEYQGKVLFSDSDHLWGTYATTAWVWKSFTRGLHVLYMENGLDCDTGGTPICHAAIRSAIGATVFHSRRVNLAAMTPAPGACNTGYCLAGDGSHIVYQPASASIVLVDLPSGNYTYERYCTTSTALISSGAFTHATGNRSVSRPAQCSAAENGAWVLIARRVV